MNLDKQTLKNIKNTLEVALDRGVFSAFALGVVNADETCLEIYGGAHSHHKNSQKTNANSFFDLASLTKVFGMASLLLSSKRLKKIPSNFIDIFYPQLKSYTDLSLDSILRHRTGLPAHIKLDTVFDSKGPLRSWEQRRKHHILEWIQSLFPVYPPSTETLYSDLGFIALALALEQWQKKEFSTLVEASLKTKWNVENMFFHPLEKGVLKENCVATEIESGVMIQGEVHDQNTRFLGGASSHAGLFANLDSCLSMAQQWLKLSLNRHPNFSKASAGAFLKGFCEARPLAWDAPSFPNSTAGNNVSPNAFGHLGYTGTSVWIDPQRELSVVLLTNRVHPQDDHQNEMKALRRGIHDLIWMASDAQS